jgi:hypothetical protein
MTGHCACRALYVRSSALVDATSTNTSPPRSRTIPSGFPTATSRRRLARSGAVVQSSSPLTVTVATTPSQHTSTRSGGMWSCVMALTAEPLAGRRDAARQPLPSTLPASLQGSAYPRTYGGRRGRGPARRVIRMRVVIFSPPASCARGGVAGRCWYCWWPQRGAVLAATAGVSRAQSAYPRFLTASKASDVLLC